MLSFTFQIDWKQRFFVPTDVEAGLAVLDSLLDRYPIVSGEASAESQLTSIEPHELSTPHRVNLDDWFVPVTETALVTSLVPDEVETPEPSSSLAAFHLAPATAPAQCIIKTQLALDLG